MMDADGHIYFLEQRLADLPGNDDWLSSAEHSTLGSLCVPKRRSDWRLGRWTAKCAVSAYLGWPKERLRDIEVHSLPSGAPHVTVRRSRLTPEISISHSCGVCLCVVGAPGVWIGCDIEKLEVRSQSFIDTFFTPHEVARLATVPISQRKIMANIIWSTKESYLKSTREGLTRDTRDVGTDPPESLAWQRDSGERTRWHPIGISDRQKRAVAYWKLESEFVETVCLQGAPIVAVRDLAKREYWRVTFHVADQPASDSSYAYY